MLGTAEMPGREASFLYGVLIFLADETGQDLIEYGLVAVLLSLCAISTLQGVSTRIVNLLTLVSNGLSSAV